MEFKELVHLGTAELSRMKAEKRKSLFELKLKNQLGHLPNPIEIRMVRKQIAKIDTALSAKKQERSQ